MLLRNLLGAVLACASLAAIAAPNGNANTLVVSVAVTDRATLGDQDVAVDVVFTNTGDAPVSVVKWFVPDGTPEGDLFLLTRNGDAVPYLGPVIKRPAPTANDMITIAPGESIVRTVELASLYDLSASGVYAIQYGAASAQMFARETVRSTRGDLKSSAVFDQELSERGVRTMFSNEVETFVEGRRNPLLDLANDSALKAGLGTKSTSFSGRCSSTQQSTIVSAVGAAQGMANDSVNYLNGTPRASTRYTTWFGTYSSAGWSEVRGHFVNIKDALDNKPLVFDCSCKKSYYAYVYPTQPYKVYLCRAFWSAPLTGTDSKGGTIVHELSHFNVIAGTDDYAYGQTAAKNLAISNPAQARLNADSHEYFAENTPSLP
jgi:peptidyl-Lys metalloendopeptidase